MDKKKRQLRSIKFEVHPELLKQLTPYSEEFKKADNAATLLEILVERAGVHPWVALAVDLKNLEKYENG